MAKTTMVAKVFGNGVWRVIYEEGKTNPFVVKHRFYDPLAGKWRTHTVVRYDTERACLHHIADKIMR